MIAERPEWEIRTAKNGWVVVAISGRIDSFNQDAFCNQIQRIVAGGNRRVAIDLSCAKFLSLPSIKWLTSAAYELKHQGGQIALLAASEKLKRQIHIYATLEPIQIVRSTADLG